MSEASVDRGEQKGRDGSPTQRGEVWRSFVGPVAGGTLALGLFVVLGEAAVWSLTLGGLVPIWVGSLCATVLAYLAFTVMHEASHGNIHGDTRSLRLVSEALGWLAGITLLAPFSAFRVLHLRHHAYTNHPEKDPDHWVKGTSALSVLLRCALIVPHYLWDFLAGPTSRTEQARASRGPAVLALAAMAAGVLASIPLGLFGWVLALWFGPAVAAAAVLAFAFDWLPHAPHVERCRFRDTRVILGPGLTSLLLYQNLHLIHHLYPRVPFYRYREVFDATRTELEREGANIVELGVKTTVAATG
jgi:fatty acid desaturase